MVKLSPSDAISLSSALIALSAFGISIWQGYIARKHNILSVRPYLEFVFRVKPDTPFTIEIKNNGFGPAIIKGITAKINDEEIPLHTLSNFKQLIAKIFPDEAKVHYNFGIHDPDSMLAAGETLKILEVKFVENSDQPVAISIKTLPNFDLALEYTCIYNNSFTSHGNVTNNTA